VPRRYERPLPSRTPRKTILIVCEGEKTEPLYFRGIREHKKLKTMTVKIHKAGNTDPASIINQTIDERQNLKDDDRWRSGDSAWAVFDGDEHMERDINNWRKALALAEKQKIDLAITNPSFEFWYLIHYQDAFGQMNANTAYKKLQKHLSNYTKSQTLFPDPLLARTPDAIQRAEKIATQIAHTALAPYSNPCCSRLPELVRMLLELP
jgi:RloB-like protein